MSDPIIPMNFQTTARSAYRVFRNRTQVSSHATEREAVCAAFNLKIAAPDAEVSIDHDLQIDIEIKGEES